MLYLAGTGIDLFRDLTIGVLELARESDQIFTFSLSSEAVERLEKLGVKRDKFNFIDDMYVEGSQDSETYTAIAEYVVSRSSNEIVSMLWVSGHPRLAVTLAQIIEKLCESEGLSLHFLPGISSFDTMINDLKIDPLDRGALLLDANRLLFHRTSLDGSYDTYIYHVSSVAQSTLDFSHPEKSNDISVLVSHLQSQFGLGKRCVILSSAPSSKGQAEVFETTLSDLCKHVEKLHYGVSLFIPRNNDVFVDIELLKLVTLQGGSQK